MTHEKFLIFTERNELSNTLYNDRTITPKSISIVRNVINAIEEMFVLGYEPKPSKHHYALVEETILAEDIILKGSLESQLNEIADKYKNKIICQNIEYEWECFKITFLIIDDEPV